MRGKFPDNFLWGAATSAYQVEGDNTHNDWWQWEQAGGTEPSGKACDHYHRFREDLHIAKGLAHNTHRFSLEWSRLEQDEGVWDQTEWAHYKEVVDELTNLKIEPIATLNHFTLPLWLAKKGGWKNEEVIKHFTRFAAQAVEELGDKVQYWITINEPNVLATLGYWMGKWPPQEKGFGSMTLALKHMLKSHAGAYCLMHQTAQANPHLKEPKIGIAKAVTAFHPCKSNSILDRLFTHYRNNFFNHSFIRSAMLGSVLLPKTKKEKLPIKNAFDFLGLNYYSRQFIHSQKPFAEHPFGEVCSLDHHKNAGKTTDMGWEIYPKGISEIVKNFSCYKLPILISENGLATTNDSLRKDFIKDHLEQILRLLSQGAPIIGYLHWSLLDNFEWSDGYRPRFGLVHVDYETQERKIKDSAQYLAEIIHSGKV